MLKDSSNLQKSTRLTSELLFPITLDWRNPKQLAIMTQSVKGRGRSKQSSPFFSKSAADSVSISRDWPELISGNEGIIEPYLFTPRLFIKVKTRFNHAPKVKFKKCSHAIRTIMTVSSLGIENCENIIKISIRISADADYCSLDRGDPKYKLISYNWKRMNIHPFI